MSSRAFLLLALAAAGCVNQRQFAPREHQNGTGPGGCPAALYTLPGPPAAGEVRVWSEGSSLQERDGEASAVLHVGFEIENHGPQNGGSGPLVFDPASLRCDDVRAGDRALGSLQPDRVEGTTEVAAGSAARIDAWFLLTVKPRELTAFAVRFRILAGGEPVLQQMTPFRPYVPPHDWRGDPYWGGYGSPAWYGPGFGIGWHWHHAHWF